MEYTYSEFCAGIGGFRIGIEKNKQFRCKYSCEINEKCEDTYFANFGDNFAFHDIFEIDSNSLPYVDLICAGFPCQPFSIAGKQAGFEDPRGTIVLKLLQIVKDKQPKVVFLENVKNFIYHNKGNTFNSVLHILNTIGYNVYFKVLNAKYFGVPQSRERVYIVAFRKDIYCNDFKFTEKRTDITPIRAILLEKDNTIPISCKWKEYIDLYTNKISLHEMSFKPPKTREKLEKINLGADIDDCIYQIRSSGIRAISIDSPFPTFAVSHSGGGAMIPVLSKKRRHLSLIEIKRLMGFPDDFIFLVSRTDAIKQLSNAVCPSVISSVVDDIVKILI